MLVFRLNFCFFSKRLFWHLAFSFVSLCLQSLSDGPFVYETRPSELPKAHSQILTLTKPYQDTQVGAMLWMELFCYLKPLPNTLAPLGVLVNQTHPLGLQIPKKVFWGVFRRSSTFLEGIWRPRDPHQTSFPKTSNLIARSLGP